MVGVIRLLIGLDFHPLGFLEVHLEFAERALALLNEPKHDARFVKEVASIAREPAHLRLRGEVFHADHTVVLLLVISQGLKRLDRKTRNVLYFAIFLLRICPSLLDESEGPVR